MAFKSDIKSADLSVCMAKTQYGFSFDPTLHDARSGYVVPVRLGAAAGFVVVILTMLSLFRIPSAEQSMLNEATQIEGLF